MFLNINKHLFYASDLHCYIIQWSLWMPCVIQVMLKPSQPKTLMVWLTTVIADENIFKNTFPAEVHISCYRECVCPLLVQYEHCVFSNCLLHYNGPQSQWKLIMHKRPHLQCKLCHELWIKYGHGRCNNNCFTCSNTEY